MHWFRAYQLSDGSSRTGPGVNGLPYWNSTYDISAGFLMTGEMPPSYVLTTGVPALPPSQPASFPNPDAPARASPPSPNPPGPPRPAPLPKPAPPPISYPAAPLHSHSPSYPSPAPPSIVLSPPLPIALTSQPSSLEQFNQMDVRLVPPPYSSSGSGPSSSSGLASGQRVAVITASAVGGLVVLAALAGIAYVSLRRRQSTWAPDMNHGRV